MTTQRHSANSILDSKGNLSWVTRVQEGLGSGGWATGRTLSSSDAVHPLLPMPRNGKVTCEATKTSAPLFVRAAPSHLFPQKAKWCKG